MPFAFGAYRTVQGLMLATALVLPLLLIGCSTRPRPPATTRTTAPPSTGPQPTDTPPVLLVGGTLQSISIINQTRSYLTARGYRTYSMTLEGSLVGVNASSTESGRSICSKIDQIRRETGADRVDVAGHSQGSIAGREPTATCR